jgi:hypothetical protein
MTLSSLIGSLTRRDAVPSPAPRQPISNPPSSPDVMTLVEARGLQFVPSGEGEGRSLGAQQDVRERIADVLPGVTFDEEGRGAFTRTGYEVSFDTGCDDFVTAVRVQITGGAAAMPPLQRLVAKTGWRLQAEHSDS